jgi:AraC-like DNA-binding protein
LASSIVSGARLSAPWAIHSNGADCPIFHAIVEGQAYVKRVADGEIKRLEEGDIVVVTRGDAHVMADDPKTPPAPITSFKRTMTAGGVAHLEYGGGGAQTRIICGKFQLDHEGAESLVALLPPLLHVSATSADGSKAAWVDTTLRILDTEIREADAGGDAMIVRLTDILFVQVLRRFWASSGESVKGWLAAVKDHQIGQALALIHEQPAERWDAKVLGAKVGLSRTRFFERFTELVGEPPARYVARWRVSAATDLMRKRSLSTAQIAERVGYASEDAFTKVFKRHLGMSPSAYRRRMRTNASAN